MEPVATEAWATSVVAAWLELPATQWTYSIMLTVIVLTCLCSLSALACLLPCAISGWLLRHMFACGTPSYSQLDTCLIGHGGGMGYFSSMFGLGFYMCVACSRCPIRLRASDQPCGGWKRCNHSLSLYRWPLGWGSGI